MGAREGRVREGRERRGGQELVWLTGNGGEGIACLADAVPSTG